MAENNYENQLLKDFASGRLGSLLKPGTLTMGHVYHDSWCKMLKKGKKHGPCNCNPEIKYVPFTGE